MRHIGFIDITVKIEAESLADFLYCMEDTQEWLEEVGGMHGEILEINVREDPDDPS